jgi:hypothetical protein
MGCVVDEAVGEDEPQFRDRKSVETFWLMLIKALTSSLDRLSIVFWSAWLNTALAAIRPEFINVAMFDMLTSIGALKFWALQRPCGN